MDITLTFTYVPTCLATLKAVADYYVSTCLNTMEAVADLVRLSVRHNCSRFGTATSEAPLEAVANLVRLTVRHNYMGHLDPFSSAS